jgi:hypothetical protein
VGRPQSTTSRLRLLVAVASWLAAIATAYGAATSGIVGHVVWGLAALAATLVALLATSGLECARSDADPLEAIRGRSLALSTRELQEARALQDSLDGMIPVEVEGTRDPLTARALADALASASRDRWLVEGAAGAGKSVLLHRIACTMNEKPDGPVAVVVMLATYDSKKTHLREWLVPEIAQLLGADPADVERLLAGHLILPLFDGLETVPDAAALALQSFPLAETAFFNRISGTRSRTPLDPRRRLLARLDDLGGFVIAARNGHVAPEERTHLDRLNRAGLLDIPALPAENQLRSKLGELAATIAPGVADAIRSPLYLRLAGDVYFEWRQPIGDQATAEQVEAWLWDKHVEARLAEWDTRELGWEPTRVRRWLCHCAAAAEHEQAMSFARWPLLYGPRARLALRAARAVASAALVGAFALLVFEPPLSAGIATVTLPFFMLAGEGAATRVMALQRFGPGRFALEAMRQWPFALAFLAAGTIFGFAASHHLELRLHTVTSNWLTILTGTIAGAMLGVVPTLYELFYVDDATLYSGLTPRRAFWSTLGASLAIGVSAGVIVALALDVVFRTPIVLLAVPICVVLALLDSLGVPAAAVMLWALQRRGPIRVAQFLAMAAEVHLVRPVGYYYFFEHGELQRYLASTAKATKQSVGPLREKTRFGRLATAGAAITAAWLVAYPTLHLASTLPHEYLAVHWRIAWVGYDLAMASLAATTCFLLIRRSAFAALASASLAALIAADAWFDCLTARHNDLNESLLSLLVEIPGVIFFIWVAVIALRAHHKHAQTVQATPMRTESDS